jgi:hypothetical protein
LTRDWIGDSAFTVYPHVKDILIKFFNPNEKYRNLYLALPIGRRIL